MRVFVCTGGAFHKGLDEIPVCIDLICEGTLSSGVQESARLTKYTASLGAPANTVEASEVITGNTESGSRTYRLLDIKHLLAAKLAAFATRASSNDLKDLIWLLNSRYGMQIRDVSGTMPLEQRRALVAAAERERPKLPAARLRRFRHLLRLA
jgi:hypothetical protein